MFKAFLSSTYVSSKGLSGMEGFTYEAFPVPSCPLISTQWWDLRTPLLSSKLFTQYHQKKKRKKELWASSPFSILWWGLFSLFHFALGCRAIEVALNGTHSTQREYCLTTPEFERPTPSHSSFFFCPYLPAPWLQRRGKKMWNRARLIVVSVLYPHFVLLEVRNLCCGWISLLDLAPNPSNPILQFKRWSERWRSAIAECPSYFQSLFGDYLWKKSICCISITFGCF